MLADRTVLILVDEQVREAGGEDVVQMSGSNKSRCRVADGLRIRRGAVDDAGIVPHARCGNVEISLIAKPSSVVAR